MSRLWALAESLAEQIRRQADNTVRGQARTHPGGAAYSVDVRNMAEALGAVVYDRADLVEDGLLVPSPRGWQILVSRSAPRARARFTIAHELVHLALREPHIGGQAALAATAPGHGFRSVERLCDCAGAALLLPARTTSALDRRAVAELGRGHLLRTRYVAAETSTSLSAAFIRLHGLRSWTSVLLQWRRGRRGWLVQTEMGLGAAFPDVCAPSNALELSLAQLATLARGTLVTTQLPLGGDEWIDADVLIGQQSVTAVIEAGRSVGSYSSAPRKVAPIADAFCGSPRTAHAY
jgi:Zn-dependent peptidase ImmA (M78 family)